MNRPERLAVSTKSSLQFNSLICGSVNIMVNTITTLHSNSVSVTRSYDIVIEKKV